LKPTRLVTFGALNVGFGTGLLVKATFTFMEGKVGSDGFGLLWLSLGLVSCATGLSLIRGWAWHRALTIFWTTCMLVGTHIELIMRLFWEKADAVAEVIGCTMLREACANNVILDGEVWSALAVTSALSLYPMLVLYTVNCAATQTAHELQNTEADT